MQIDSHQHFWSLDRGDYAWPTPDLALIYRDFDAADLGPLLAATGVDGSILVQATPTTAETQFLLEVAARHTFVKGVVGWVDFDRHDASASVARLAGNPRLKGLRPMIQGIADDHWMLQAHLAPVFDMMVQCGLVFDALIRPQHLPILARLLHRNPRLSAVIDHAAKPQIAAAAFDDWAAAMARIARETQVCCKLSGLWTEAGGDTGISRIGRYVDHLLACFGPDRLLWGSDWPVVLLAGEYGAWHAQCRDLLSHLSAADQDAIFGGNARRFYALS